MQIFYQLPPAPVHPLPWHVKMAQVPRLFPEHPDVQPHLHNIAQTMLVETVIQI